MSMQTEHTLTLIRVAIADRRAQLNHYRDTSTWIWRQCDYADALLDRHHAVAGVCMWCHHTALCTDVITLAVAWGVPVDYRAVGGSV
jgi:hypothetical protein